MAEWFGNPIVIVAVLSVVGLVFATGQWVGRVNSHISVVGALLKEIRQDINEIRQDIKEILGRLPPAVVAGKSTQTGSGPECKTPNRERPPGSSN